MYVLKHFTHPVETGDSIHRTIKNVRISVSSTKHDTALYNKEQSIILNTVERRNFQNTIITSTTTTFAIIVSCQKSM
jgi:hypothetical protein